VVDVNGEYWIVEATGAITPSAPEETQLWIDEGKSFAQRSLDGDERGVFSGFNLSRALAQAEIPDTGNVI
jgi:hypothetical protein